MNLLPISIDQKIDIHHDRIIAFHVLRATIAKQNDLKAHWYWISSETENQHVRLLAQK